MSDYSKALRGLMPDRWLVGGLLVTWGMRALGWGLRGALTRPESTLREGFKGLIWDLALVYALFALMRTGSALMRANNTLRLRETAPRPLFLTLLGGSLSAGVLIIGGLSPLLRALDAAHCYIGRSHFGLEGFQYLSGDFLGRLRDPSAFGLLILALSLSAFMILALWRYAAKRPRDTRDLWISALLPLLLATPPAAWALRDSLVYPASVYDLRLIPEMNLALKWLDWRRNRDRRPGTFSPLNLVLALKLKKLGMLPATELRSDFPLVRAGLGEPPLPYPIQTPNAEKFRPNVVLVFVESLSSLFVHELSGRYKGLMPKLGALSREMTVVRGYHNTTSPTIGGLVTGMCSILTSSHPSDLKAGESVDGGMAYTCLADLLRARGYRTVFLQAASLKVASEAFFLRTHGFDEVIGREALRSQYPSLKQGVWGIHDDALVGIAEEEIERLEAARGRDKRPFLFAMITLDSHDPGMAAASCKLPTDATGADLVRELPKASGARKLAAAYHCTDAALGKLGRFLLAPERRDRTLWALTGDHAPFHTLNSDPLFVGPDEGWTFAPLPLLLHDPRHNLPPSVHVLSGTGDLTPTLLHLLNLDPPLHSLGGHSVFGRRPDLPWLVGRVGGRLAYVQSSSARRELPIDHLSSLCAKNEPLLKDGTSPLTACELRDWIRWQDGLWAARRLFPKKDYAGAQGVDAGWLRDQMELNDAEKRAAGLPVGSEVKTHPKNSKTPSR